MYALRGQLDLGDFAYGEGIRSNKYAFTNLYIAYQNHICLLKSNQIFANCNQIKIDIAYQNHILPIEIKT